MNNQKLIIEAQQGSKTALSELLLSNKGIISSVVHRFLYEQEHHEDLIQTILTKVIATIKHFNGTCRFSTWLYRIATNECLEFVRKKSRNKNYFSPLPDNLTVFKDCNAPDPLISLSDQELRTSIQNTLNSLPLDQRTAFSLYYFGNYKGKEVAEVLNITEANFYMKLKTARDVIKQKLKKQGWAQ